MTYTDLSIKLKELGFKSIRPNLLMFPCKQSFDIWNEFFNYIVCIVSNKMLEFPILLFNSIDYCWESVNFKEFIEGD